MTLWGIKVALTLRREDSRVAWRRDRDSGDNISQVISLSLVFFPDFEIAAELSRMLVLPFVIR